VKQPRQLRGLLGRHGKASAPIPAQVVVTAPTFPPSRITPRLKALRWFRGRTTAPVPAQAAVAPAFPPQTVRVPHPRPAPVPPARRRPRARPG
jgi:hypothetical protein